DVEYPSWVLVGYPRYAPQILDLVTLDDVIGDLAIRELADRTDLFGAVGTYDDPQEIDPRDPQALIDWKNQVLDWNPSYKPWFYRDIWPILYRPDQFSYLSNILGQSNFPHNQSTRGTFDPKKLSIPPEVDQEALAACEQDCIARNESGELVLERLHPFLHRIKESLNVELQHRIAGFDDVMRAIPKP